MNSYIAQTLSQESCYYSSGYSPRCSTPAVSTGCCSPSRSCESHPTTPYVRHPSVTPLCTPGASSRPGHRPTAPPGCSRPRNSPLAPAPREGAQRSPARRLRAGPRGRSQRPVRPRRRAQTRTGLTRPRQPPARPPARGLPGGRRTERGAAAPLTSARSRGRPGRDGEQEPAGPGADGSAAPGAPHGPPALRFRPLTAASGRARGACWVL